MKTQNMTTQLIELSEKAQDSILFGNFSKAQTECNQIVKVAGGFFN
jgi:hypothetical protein